MQAQVNWKPTLDENRSIVLWNTCHSAENNSAEGWGNVMDAAGGRWRLGFVGEVNVAYAGFASYQLVFEMSGEENQGDRRTTGEAFAYMQPVLELSRPPGVTAVWRGNPWTTLWPSPLAEPQNKPLPAPGSGAPEEGWGCFLFDTYVDGSVPVAEAVLQVKGSPVTDLRWIYLGAGARGVGFRYDRSGGTLRLLFDPEKVKGEGGGFPLKKRYKYDDVYWDEWRY